MIRIAMVLILCFTSLGYGQNSRLANVPEVKAGIDLLSTWIDGQMSFYNLPGLAIGIVYDQELVWAKGYGVADLEHTTPVTPSSIFRIASITKLFTSIAIMQLRDQSKLRLDDEIAVYLRWFKIKNTYPDAPAITIRHLLTHTSGLPREAAFPYWTDHNFPTRDQIIAALPDQETIFAPDTRWKYSNLAIALAGEIVVAVSGEPYVEYIQKHVLAPLEMMSTFVEFPLQPADRLVTGYGRRQPDGTRPKSPVTEANGLKAAANMSSTVVDLARLIMLQFRDGKEGGAQILRGSTLREMHRIHWLQPSWKSGWGLGFSVRRAGDRTLVGHSGWVAGNRTQISFSPEEKIGVIVLTNADDSDPGKFVDQVFQLVAPAIRKAGAPDEKPAQVNPVWQKYVGLYTDPWTWDTQVMILNNKLYLYGYEYPPETSARDALVELTPEAPNIFRMTGDNGDGERVVFELGRDGKVERVKVGENYIYPKK